MQLTISHTTRYSYEAPVHYALQRARLIPQDTPQQRVKDWNLEVTGGKSEARYRDHHGNTAELLSVDPGATEITITARGVVETIDTAGVLGHVTGPAPLWLYQQATALTEPGDGIAALIAAHDDSDVLESLHALSALIRDRVAYATGETSTGVTAEQALKGGRGVCQDHSHIFIAAARARGIPARYASGYLLMGDRIDQDAGHAWAEAHVPALGWVGFDVSNGQSPDDRYVRLAIGRDYHDAAPLAGMRQGPGSEAMAVSLQVQQ